jgi:hypothetical protein
MRSGNALSPTIRRLILLWVVASALCIQPLATVGAQTRSKALVIFDPQRVIDRSTFKELQLLPVGIERVFVNGEPVWEHDHATDRLPGVVLQKNLLRAKSKQRRSRQD